ncbi:long-chain fatty acid--CoA ligase [Nocardioides humilatus]|uniref:Long-chain fatty acid--CoA ligase n=1 Tax=Nocardioides humilatus TaxID=2607660 RepID=A0A5B1L8C2_9ACTN|nr:long-chain fatty acid--CoA ligase [Nocardioides humilatus]KAA1416943.1 long-chain fatty acid--CoA ligase [Nocardioides humilatus]
MYLTQGLHRALQAKPAAIATICGDRVRTIAEQGDRVARLASGLRSLGVAEGDRVAILAMNSDRYAEYLLAVPWAGAVVNPVNIRWSATEVAYSLRDSDTRVLLVDDAFSPMVPALTAEWPQLATLVHCGDGPTPEGMVSYEELVASSSPAPDVRREGDDLAGLFYTGGTTGFPKGVMLSHANLVTSSFGCMTTGRFLPPGSVFLHAAPMFHLADLAAWVSQTARGGTHVMVPFFEPKAVLDAIQAHSVTDVLLVPTMIQMLVDHPDISQYDLSSLERVMYGGSSIAEGVLRRTMEVLPNVQMIQAYGMTELAPAATLLTHEDHHGRYLRSAGKAAPHTEVEIRDESGIAVPTGTVGEICVRGGNVMLGYWNKPEETAAALKDGWMHTGDGGYLDDDGFVYVVDRIKDMIVSGGENVYSAEVETALSKHPAVLASAVIGLPDEQWGERVHACVVLAPNAVATAEELASFCKEHIAGYKTPRSVDFVDELPISGAGKILKRELRARYAEQAEA